MSLIQPHPQVKNLSALWLETNKWTSSSPYRRGRSFSPDAVQSRTTRTARQHFRDSFPLFGIGLGPVVCIARKEGGRSGLLSVDVPSLLSKRACLSVIVNCMLLTDILTSGRLTWVRWLRQPLFSRYRVAIHLHTRRSCYESLRSSRLFEPLNSSEE